MKSKIKEVAYTPAKNGVMIHIETKSESGLQLPDSVTMNVDASKYQIVKVGPTVEHTKVGDWVDFVMHCAPTAVIVDGEKYMVLKEHEILGYYK